MSIQEQIARISGQVTEQESLINQIISELEGKTAASPSAPAEPVVKIGTTTQQNGSNATSIQFTGLKGRPKAFSVVAGNQISQSSTRTVAAVHSDGENTYGIYLYKSGSTATMYYSASYFSWEYSDGTLTIETTSSTNGGNFLSTIAYRLIYIYEEGTA